MPATTDPRCDEFGFAPVLSLVAGDRVAVSYGIITVREVIPAGEGRCTIRLGTNP